MIEKAYTRIVARIVLMNFIMRQRKLGYSKFTVLTTSSELIISSETSTDKDPNLKRIKY